MKRLGIFILIVTVGLGSLNAQWFNLTSPTSTHLYSTYFPNYDTGYAVGGNINSSVFLKTTNGGADWDLITNTQTNWMYDLVFLNDTVGIACGYDGAIYKTTDAGLSWNAKPSQTTAWLYAIAKKPDGTLYATGQDGTLIKSVNGGDNWNIAVSSTIQTMLDIQFYDNNIGAAVGYAGEMIYTTDGGNNWSVKLMGTPGNITGLWILSPDTIWTCGIGGKLYKTTNAGQNFTFSTPGINDLNSIFFVDDMNGYLAGSQKLYQTTNGGNSWVEMLPYPTANAMKDIHVSPDNRVMYGVGDNGAIIKNINSIGIKELNEEFIALYPNPTHGILKIGIEGSYWVQLMDLKGNLLASNYFKDVHQAEMDLSFLSDGIYILEVKKMGKVSRGRIIVNH